jgi:hypothetical protein
MYPFQRVPKRHRLFVARSGRRPVARLLCATALIVVPFLLPASAQGETPHGVGVPPIFAGTDEGTIFVSRNGGATWQESDRGLRTTGLLTVAAIAVAPNQSDTIYVAGDTGLYFSHDGGADWSRSQGLSDMRSVVVDPRYPNTVYAAGKDISVSTDGGVDWSRLSAPQALDQLALDFHQPATLLAAGDQFAGGYSATGMVRSTDGGATWKAVGPPHVVVNQLAFSFGDPSVAYAATTQGLYRSADGGRTWAKPTGLPATTPFMQVAPNPHNTQEVVAYTLYANSASAFSIPGYNTAYRSLDGGVTWAVLTGPFQLDALTFDPAAPDTVLFGGDTVNAVSPSGVAPHPAPLPGCCLLALGAGHAAQPTDPVATPVPGAETHYFAQTSHTAGGALYRFWSAHGGLTAFGLPLTEPYVERGRIVQYFERAAFVLQGSAVTLLPLGRTLTKGRAFPAVGAVGVGAGGRYFSVTKHSLSGRFLTYWLAHEGSVLLGAPISEPLREANGDGSGRRYLVQYFANGRLEYHPEITQAAFQVQGGQVGRDVLQQRGWL